jgi:hypothetical protein
VNRVPWVMKPYRLVSSYQHFAENLCLRLCPAWSPNVETEISSKHQSVLYERHRLIYHSILLSNNTFVKTSNICLLKKILFLFYLFIYFFTKKKIKFPRKMLVHTPITNIFPVHWVLRKMWRDKTRDFYSSTLLCKEIIRFSSSSS